MGETAKHTPGPWTTERVFGDHDHDICLGYDIPGEGSPILLATVFPDEEREGPIGVEQASANALLIAAAPELLAALEGMGRTHLDGLPCFCALEINWGRLYDHTPDCLAARAAIAKATGQPAPTEQPTP